MTKYREDSVKKNIILSTAYQVLTMIIPLITAPYVSRVLGADGIGIYSYTQSYSMYFALFAALGTVAYGTREIAQHRDNVQERSQLFWEIACLSFVTSLICIALWGVWIAFNTKYKFYYLVWTFSLLGTMFDISWFYAGLEKFRYTLAQNSLFKVLGTIAIFVFVKEKGDLWIYILILSLTVFLASISMWIYLPRFITRVPIKGIRLKHHFKETLVYFIPTIAISIYTILDKTLIGLITHDTSENGNYEQATKIINMAKMLSFAGVNMVLQSRISYLFTGDNKNEIKDRINASMEYILFMGIALTFGIIGVSGKFVPWFFGEGYDKTIILLKLMAPLTVIIGVSNCLGSQYYTPAGLRAKSSKYIVAGSIINLICNLMLIPLFKSEGAVMATLLAETSITVLYMANNNGFYSGKQLGMQLWKKLIAGLLMCAVVLVIDAHINKLFLGLVVEIAAGAFIYIVALIAMKDSFAYSMMIPAITSTLKKKDNKKIKE